MTDSFLSNIRSHPRLPLHTWYAIAGTTLSALNRPEEVPIVFKHALEKGVGGPASSLDSEQRLRVARRLREALVKATAVYGLPKVSYYDSCL